MKVFPLITDFLMQLSQPLDRLCPAMASALFSGKCLLCFGELLFSTSKVARVVNELSTRDGRKGGCKIKCVSWLSVEEFRRGKVEEETDDHSTRIDRRIAERLRRPA
jgi:hypothetical protein